MALKSSPKWCDLPPELVDVVGKLLGGPTDTWHMRSVCSSWRSAVPARRPGLGLAVQFPINDPIKFFLQNSSSSNDSENQNQSYLRLAKHTFFHLMPASSSAGWLIKIEEKPGGLGTTTFHLFNPFSRTRSPTHPAFNFKLDLTKLKIQELASEYVLHNHNMEHEKVALLNLTIANHHHHEYAFLSTHNTGKLLLYRSTLNEWSFLDDFILGYDDRSIFVNDWSLHYVDVVEYQGSFYAVTNSGRTVAIKLDSSSVSITLVTKSIIGGDKKCLVKSADDLLMVDLYTCPTPGASLVKVNAAEIFKLDQQQQTWVLIKTLGHRSLFLSNHSCFSASDSLPGCKPNSIFFHFKNFDYYKDDTNITDIDHHPALFSWNRDEIGVFDFEKGILGSLPDYLQDSQLFSWPPPAWVITAST